MIETLFSGLLWAMIIGNGLMAGIYFAFSTFIMGSLGAIQPESGIAAMQSINRMILKSAFMVLFVVTTGVSILVAALALYQWGMAGTLNALIASAVYFIGMFMVTALINVPLNNRLEKINSHDRQSQIEWQDYRKNWTHANHLRTASSLVSMILYVYALSMQ